MGKPKNVVPMTLSVPKEVKTKMDAVKVSVNWSAIATAAFETKILELMSKREVKSMTDLVSRLKAAEELEANEDYQDGHPVWREMGSGKATPRQLRRLQALTDDPKRTLPEWLNYCAADGMTAELMNKLADNPQIAPQLAMAGALPYFLAQ